MSFSRHCVQPIPAATSCRLPVANPRHAPDSWQLDSSKRHATKRWWLWPASDTARLSTNGWNGSTSRPAFRSRLWWLPGLGAWWSRCSAQGRWLQQHRVCGLIDHWIAQPAAVTLRCRWEAKPRIRCGFYGNSYFSSDFCTTALLSRENGNGIEGGRRCLLDTQAEIACLLCVCVTIASSATLEGKKNMVRYGGGHALLRLVMIGVVESEMICNEALHSNPPR